MSTFAVTIETIGEVRDHTNADRLEMATLAGKDYDFVVGKGEFEVGEAVVYFPVDSELPQWITDALQLTSRLAGSAKNRVKTIKLRGNISQGLVAKPTALAHEAPSILQAQVGDAVTDILGVTKYDPPPVMITHGELRPLPKFVSKYDIEGAQNHVALAGSLMDERVYITEKLEGSHWSITYLREDDVVYVSQRNYRIEPNGKGEHVWHKLAREGNYEQIVRQIADELDAQAITLRGEAVGSGIQGDYYKLKEHRLYIFEIEVDGVPLPAGAFLTLAEQYALPIVPVLAKDIILREWLDEQTLKLASDGRSKIADKAREGIVIKPMVEQRDDAVGRVFLKQRSPAYLAKSDF
ncbi:MAG: RNA ligase (ATP) [Chloroflexota bacterium]